MTAWGQKLSAGFLASFWSCYHCREGLCSAHLWSREKICSEDFAPCSSIPAVLTPNPIPWQVFLFINATEKPAPALWAATPGDPP